MVNIEMGTKWVYKLRYEGFIAYLEMGYRVRVSDIKIQHLIELLILDE